MALAPMTSRSGGLDVGLELQDRALMVAPALRERAAEGESLRTMPADLAARLKVSGLFRMALPADLGGWEADPMAIFEVVETLAAADGSGAWTTLIGNTQGLLAWLEPAVATGLLAGDPNRAAAGTFAPLGRAVPERGGFTVTGRWPFASGAPHAELVFGGVLVMDGDGPRLRPDGRLDWRFAWFGRDDVEVVHTWHGAGLRGTGSHDIAVHKVHVREERTCAPMFDRPHHDGPLYRLSFRSYLAPLMAGFASGVGRHAVDRFVELAQTKRRGTGPAVRDDPCCQAEVATADTRLRAARALFVDAVGDAWTTVSAGRPSTLDQRAAIIGAAQLLLRAARSAADHLLPFAGASSVRDDEPLQRCRRDLHAAGQHIFFAPDATKRVGSVLLGVPPDDVSML